MVRTLLLAAGTAFCSIVVAPAAVQANEAFVFSKSSSRIEFVVHHHGLSLMKGTFKDFDGRFEIDPSALEDSHVEVTIQTASIDAGHSHLDGHLRSRDFFDVARFPTITFKSTHILVTGEHTGQIQGELMLLGITHPLVLEVTLADSDAASTPRVTANFIAEGTISRTEFGMDWGPSGFAEDVDIRIEVAGQRL